MRPRRIVLSSALTGLALIITALLVAWHVAHALEAGPLWRDEAHVVNWASFPTLAEVWSNRDVDALPVTWPLLIHGWISLAGGSDASLRALGALVGIAGLAAVWWTTRQLGGRAPLFALVLYAANPCVLVYGDSMRGYGLGLLALVVFLGAIGAVVARPGWRTLAVAQLAALFVVQADFRNCVFVLAGLVGAAAVAAHRRRWKLAALDLALGVIPLASLLPYVSTYRKVSEWIVVWAQDVGYAYLFEIFAGALRTAGPWVWQIFGLVVLLALAECARAIASPRQPPDPLAQDRAIFFAVTLAIGVLGYFFVLDSLRRVTQIWYYQYPIAVLALCADGALALRGEASRLWTGAKLALAGSALVLGSTTVWQSRSFRMTNVDEIAARLERDAAPDDLILVAPYHLGPTFDRYYRGPAPWITLPDVGKRFQDPRAVKERISRRDPIRAELDRIAATLRAGRRVWMVGEPTSAPGVTPPDPPPAPAARTGWLEFPYLYAWSAQAGALAAREARAVRLVAPPSDGAVNYFENAPLYVAEP